MDSCEVAVTDVVERRSNLSSAQNNAILREYPDVLDITQMSDILGVSTKTGYALLRSGLIAYLKIGRSYRIPKVKLLDYLNSAKTCN